MREAKAIAVGYESVIREKEFAADAQLAATEIVRRCERRIGELVRVGQERGEILRQGQTLARLDPTRGGDLRRPHEAMGVSEHDHKAIADLYAAGDAPSETFEQAITEAKAEGNLSRANVVRKVRGEPEPGPERSEWHRKKRRLDPNRILRSCVLRVRDVGVAEAVPLGGGRCSSSPRR